MDLTAQTGKITEIDASVRMNPGKSFLVEDDGNAMRDFGHTMRNYRSELVI